MINDKLETKFKFKNLYFFLTSKNLSSFFNHNFYSPYRNVTFYTLKFKKNVIY